MFHSKAYITIVACRMKKKQQCQLLDLNGCLQELSTISDLTTNTLQPLSNVVGALMRKSRGAIQKEESAGRAEANGGPRDQKLPFRQKFDLI